MYFYLILHLNKLFWNNLTYTLIVNLLIMIIETDIYLNLNKSYLTNN